MTLLALVLAIGLVVDDAIVMLENIYRHIEEGMKPFDAALKGAKEIGFAVVAMTLTLAAVYAPVAFTPGRTGRLFSEFALTLAGAVVVSGFVALTLSPMMCSKLLRRQEKHGVLYRIIENGLNGITAVYGRMLELDAVGALAGGSCVYLLVIGALVWLGMTMKKELAPIEDRGTIFVSLSGPDGASLDYTQKYALQLEGIAAETPEIDRVFVIAGNPDGRTRHCRHAHGGLGRTQALDARYDCRNASQDGRRAGATGLPERAALARTIDTRAPGQPGGHDQCILR